MSPSTPVILVEGVFNRDDVVLLGVRDVEVGKFDSGEPFRGVGVGVLEAEMIEKLGLHGHVDEGRERSDLLEIVLSVLVEFRGSDVTGGRRDFI